MKTETKEQRDVKNEELRIILLLGDMTERGTKRHDRQYHILRETVNGNKVGGCDVVKHALDEGSGYHSVQFFKFLADHVEKDICYWCHMSANVDERLRG